MEPNNKRWPIGQLLLRRKTLSQTQLDDALRRQGSSGERLASQCLAQKLGSERDLLAALSAQAGVPGVCLSNLVLPLRYLEVVPEATAIERVVLPVDLDDERVFLAMADPDQPDVLAEIGFVAKRQVFGCVALSGLLRRLVRQGYEAKRRGELELRGPGASDQQPSVPTFVLIDAVIEVPEDLLAMMPAATSVTRPDERASNSGRELVIDLDDLGDLGGVEIDANFVDLEDVSYPGADAKTLPTPRASHTGASERTSAGPVRVLVVEDDEETRSLVARLLASEGMQVDQAGRGLEALSRVKDRPPDLVILDAMLPEVHGFDIAKKLRASERYGRIPIIMLSSVYRGWRIARDLKESYGVEAFLEKPFKINDLLSTVRRVVAASQRQRHHSDPRQTAASATKARAEGIARYEAGDLAGAIECFSEAVRIDPLSSRLHLQLGVLYLKRKGMVFQAMRELEEAVALEPELFTALRTLAVLYQRKGFRNKAIDMWERALQCCTDPVVREKIRKHVVMMIKSSWA